MLAEAAYDFSLQTRDCKQWHAYMFRNPVTKEVEKLEGISETS